MHGHQLSRHGKTLMADSDMDVDYGNQTYNDAKWVKNDEATMDPGDGYFVDEQGDMCKNIYKVQSRIENMTLSDKKNSIGMAWTSSDTDMPM